ncbi:MAG: hypothetical protein HYX92_11365 [Chloroflexi bacterium]|nr:hypothetical protein [Chloroflexota bacterium]
MKMRIWTRGLLCTIAVIGLFLASCTTAAPPPGTVAPTTRTGTSGGAPPSPPAGPSATPKPSADQPRYGGTLAISAQQDPVSLDMHQESTYLVENVIQCAYNGVTQFDPRNPEEVIGDLAKSWEVSRDGLTYTFQLHNNVKFHDGSPLTSQDVQFSFERMTNPPRGIRSSRRPSLEAIEKVEAPSKDTVTFKLRYPASFFLSTISTGWIAVYSRAFVERKGDMKNDVLGTGPFKLKAYAQGTSLEYVKNADYFVSGRPYLDGITFYIVKDAGTRLAAFRTGQIKLTGPGASGLTPTDAETVRKTMPQAVLLSYPAFSRTEFLMHNQRKPWSDVRVRRAAHLAVDRQKAITVLEQGYGELGSEMPGKWGIPKEELLKMPGWRQPKDADLAEAKRLLAEAGYPDGFASKALVRAEKQFEELSVYVADQLAKIGIKLELDVKEPAVREKLQNEGAFEIHPRIGSLAYADPQDLARYWSPPRGGDWGQNQERSSDEKIWELLDKQARALDPAERKRIVRELDLRIIEVAAKPVVFWRTAIVGMWPEVKDRGQISGFFSFQKYQDVWLAK